MAPKAASKDVELGDELIVKSADLLFMRDNFISGLSHLESGVHELKRAYITQFNTLLPEGHLGRLQLPYYPPTIPMGSGPAGLQQPPLIQPAIPVVAAENSNNANKKRVRKPHDVNLPKRALTSYFLFMQQTKPAIKEEHPDWDAKQISAESERRWHSISEKERATYEYMYQVDLARYYKQKECYERGEPVPEISTKEAEELYREHLKTGVPFKGRKGKKEQRPVNIPTDPLVASDMLVDDDDDDDDSDDSDELQPPPPKVAKTKAAILPKPVKGRV